MPPAMVCVPMDGIPATATAVIVETLERIAPSTSSTKCAACLGEPRPTSIDVPLSGLGKRVAIECKFMERDFGRCSRPAQDPGHPTYCDENYRVQGGRCQRCALTEIGIRY